MAEKQELPIEPEEKPKVEEFTEIGSSPVPGITLKQVLRGHTDRIHQLCWSPNGKMLASSSADKKILIWEYSSGNCINTLIRHSSNVTQLAWSPDGKTLASGSWDRTILFWDINTWKVNKELSVSAELYGMDWSPTGENLAWGAADSSVSLYNYTDGSIFQTNPIHNYSVFDVKWINNDHYVSADDIDVVRFLEKSKKTSIQIVPDFQAHVLEVSTNRELLAGGSYNGSIQIINTLTWNKLFQIEGHTDTIDSLDVSADNSLLVSSSRDHSIRLWRVQDGSHVMSLFDFLGEFGPKVVFHPVLPILSTVGYENNIIYLWEIDPTKLFGRAEADRSVRYTTAKIVLVGDSGVGKTGLGWRLAHNEFKEHSSTHGQQFWVVPELKRTRKDGTECEAVLWDLAGQHIYRSIHSIFLDDVDASLVLFDPTNRQEPLKGAQFWLEQLKGKKQLPPSVLVGARLDRGAPVLSQQELDQFCQKYGVSGGYIGTSAKSGEGLDKLLEALKSQIPWDQMTTTVTTVTFKKIKDYILALKEKPDRKGVLVRPSELRKQLQATDKDWEFADAEMMTAVGHLANHGYVTILHSSSGEEYILLVPELLASVAASIFLHADKHPRELGAINETELLQGKYAIQEFKGLEKEEQQVLLDATVVRFLEHNICFRETLGKDNLLIFPSLIKQKRPLKDDVLSTDDISYIVRGRVENIYATLVVLLGYTPSFNRINQWQNQAQYETGAGNICGFRLVEDREGEIELILYYGNEMPEDERSDFQYLFEQFLYQREVEVVPFPPVTCPNGHRQERAIVVKRSQEGKKSIFCDECGEKTELPNLDSRQPLDSEIPDWLKREGDSARLRSAYETNLARVKGHRRGWSTPRCYISYVTEQKEFAERLLRDLAEAGVFVIEDSANVEPNDNIIVVDSQSYQKAWENNAIQNEIGIIRPRLVDNKGKGLTYINQTGNTFEHTLEQCVSKSFCDPTHYVLNLFDLVLKLYAIPLNQPGFVELRQVLHQQWEQTLAPKVAFEKDAEVLSTDLHREIYVSYAWGGDSEKLVNEIDQAFLKKGVLITRDKRDLGYKGSIKEFMERIGRGKSIVVVISDKYLKSKNCMFELIQIAKNNQFKDHIFPVVLSDANIYDAIKRIEYIKHWEIKKKELNKAMKGVSAEHLKGIREEIDLFDDIRDEIAGLVDILQDMNTLTPDMHRDSDFQTLCDAVMAKLEE